MNEQREFVLRLSEYALNLAELSDVAENELWRRVDKLGFSEVLEWYYENPDSWDYATTWLQEGQRDTENMTVDDVLFGGRFIYAFDSFMAVAEDMYTEGELHFQFPQCTYCERAMKELETRADLIGEPTCEDCWNPTIDGDWSEAKPHRRLVDADAWTSTATTKDT